MTGLIASLVLSAVMAVSAVTTADGVDRYVGDWQSPADAPRIVETAVEQATARMNMFTRGVARRRLMERNAPPARIRMRRDGETFSIQFGDVAPVPLPLSGAEVQADERRMRIAFDAPSGELRHRGATADGARENLFQLVEDGRVLRMAVTVTSPRLPEPVRYTLDFTRVEPAR